MVDHLTGTIGEGATVVCIDGCAEIPGYGGAYVVSRTGQVFRMRVYAIHTKRGWQRRIKKRQLMPYLNNGIPTVCLSKNGKKRCISLQRLLLETYGTILEPVKI